MPKALMSGRSPDTLLRLIRFYLSSANCRYFLTSVFHFERDAGTVIIALGNIIPDHHVGVGFLIEFQHVL